MLRRLLTAPSARLGALQILILCLSLLSQVLIARRFGVGHELDRYFAVLGTALGVMGSLSVGTNYVLPPKIVRALAKHDRDGARIAAAEGARRILAWIGAVTLIGATGMIVASGAGGALAGAPNAGLIALGWLVAAGSACAGMLGAISTAHRRVAVPLGASALPPAAMLLALATHRDGGAVVMLTGMLTGTALQCAVLAATLRGLVDWRHGQLRWDRRENGQLLMAVAGAACFSSYSVVDAFVAPAIGAGALTLQSLGQRLVVAFGAVLSAGAFALAPDNFGRLIEAGQRRHAYRLFRRAGMMLVAITLAACAMMPIIGGGVLQLLFAGGSFRLASVDDLTMLVAILLVGSGAMLSSAIGFRLLYALAAGAHVAAASVAWLVAYLLSALTLVALGLPYPLAWAYVSSWWTVLVWVVWISDRRTASPISSDPLQDNR